MSEVSVYLVWRGHDRFLSKKSKSKKNTSNIPTLNSSSFQGNMATSTTSSDNVEHVSAVKLALNVDTPQETIEIVCGRALQGYSEVGHCRDTLRLGTAGTLCVPLCTAGILCDWALLGYSAVGHCWDTLWLSTAGILCGWGLRLGTAGILYGWALQGYSSIGHCLLGYSAVGHCRDTLRLGTAGILCSWALQSGSWRARTT